MNIKRFATMVLSIACIPTVLVGCKNKEKKDQTALTFGKLYQESKNIEDNFNVISLTDLQKMVEKKYNFAVIVYEPYNDCTCWTTFQSTLRKYMKNTNILFFGVEIGELVASNEQFGLDYRRGDETVAIFRDGVLKTQKSTGDSNDKFTSDIDTFTEWMDNNVHNSDMLFVTPAQLDSLFAGDSQFTLYIDRESCGDCSYLNANFLKEYNAGDNNRSYVIETDVEGIRYKNSFFSSELWSAWKDSMGMSSAGNEEYGYGVGYTPSFYRYDPNIMEGENRASAVFDSAVYLNDTIEKTGDNEYTVTDSFYTEERLGNLAHMDGVEIENKVLKGLKLDSTQVNEIDTGAGYSYSWKSESSASYHDPLLKAFLDLYVAKTTK